VTSSYTFGFSGALSGGVIPGMVTYGIAIQGRNDNSVNTVLVTGGSTTFPVTLR
jgi:hypothetical protein